MDNQQIIIDGIDVSKCKHFKNRTCLADYLLTDMDFSEAKCELCKDCYFKQLARKTRECEQAEQKLKQIEKLCIKNSNKSSFCNGVENKDMQKLAIRVLQIIEEVK